MRAASPRTTPDCIAARVLRPMTRSGARSSIMGSRAAAAVSERAPRATPGAMMPPANAPSRSTTTKLVVVPRSTTTTGAPYASRAATASATRSDPTSEGSS